MPLHGGGKPFPVVYFDGENEINQGVLTLDPTMNIKSVLTILSQKIGISPHQFSVFIADQGSDRKIPLTAKLNLAATVSDGGEYYFYVKRSKRSKKSPAKNKNQSEKQMSQRREDAIAITTASDGMMINGFRPGFSVAPSFLGRVEIERRIWNLKMEREAFLMSMRSNGGFVRTGNCNGGGSGGGIVSAVCKECLLGRLTGTRADFHLCVHDEMILGFRSSAGPISRR